MKKRFSRRDFLKFSGAGIATIVIGCGSDSSTQLPFDDSTDDDGNGSGNGDDTPVETLNFTITDAVKEMITHEPNGPVRPNRAECYFWVFEEARFEGDSPGPQIYAVEGDLIALNVTNNLTSRHSFAIPGMVDTGPIEPGETVSLEFKAGDAGSHLYYDNLNEPVNRMMGLHGAFIVMPAEAEEGHSFTPYSLPTKGVQQLYDDFGSTPWWPGLAWGEGDAATGTDAFRQYVWLAHESSPVLFQEVGEFCEANPGLEFDAALFVEAFTRDPFMNTSNDPRTDVSLQFPVKTTNFNRKPTFFTINGLSGHFSHNNVAICPMHRIGEPSLIRILNAGLNQHSMHLHANHFYVTAVNNEPSENPLWVDVYNVNPMDHVDYTVPFMRPPDIPNQRGIGRADAGLPIAGGINQTTWPPTQEFDMHHPPLGSLVTNFEGTALIDIAQRQSPLCYPMHDHSEASQTAQGGNYNCGMIAGIYFLGDRNFMMDFPIDADFQMMLDFGRRIGVTGPARGGYPLGDPQP